MSISGRSMCEPAVSSTSFTSSSSDLDENSVVDVALINAVIMSDLGPSGILGTYNRDRASPLAAPQTLLQNR